MGEDYIFILSNPARKVKEKPAYRGFFLTFHFPFSIFHFPFRNVRSAILSK